MVDLQTAMAAAAAERKQRAGAASEERKVRRSGPSLGIEPFDPVKHVSKESRHCFNVVGNRIFCSCIVDDAICLDAKYLARKVRHSLPNATECDNFDSPSTPYGDAQIVPGILWKGNLVQGWFSSHLHVLSNVIFVGKSSNGRYCCS